MTAILGDRTQASAVITLAFLVALLGAVAGCASASPEAASPEASATTTLSPAATPTKTGPSTELVAKRLAVQSCNSVADTLGMKPGESFAELKTRADLNGKRAEGFARQAARLDPTWTGFATDVSTAMRDQADVMVNVRALLAVEKYCVRRFDYPVPFSLGSHINPQSI